MDVPVTDSVDAIMSNAIFNQLQDRFNWDRPSSRFGADIYTELHYRECHGIKHYRSFRLLTRISATIRPTLRAR